MQFDRRNTLKNSVTPDVHSPTLLFWKGVLADSSSRAWLSMGNLDPASVAKLECQKPSELIQFFESTIALLSQLDTRKELLHLADKKPSLSGDITVSTKEAESLLNSIPETALRALLVQSLTYLNEKYLSALRSSQCAEALSALEREVKELNDCLYANMLYRPKESAEFEVLRAQYPVYPSYNRLLSFSLLPKATVAPSESLSDLLNFGDKLQFWQTFDRSVGTFDAATYERRRIEIGAKGAALEALTPYTDAVRELLGKLLINISIPHFTTVPTSLYESYRKSGEIPQNDLRRYYQATFGAKPCAYLVRSSAVYSEDGELLGAGQYATIGLTAGATFEEFIQAVKDVYDSVEHPSAVRYRQENGVTEQELMGLVIMELSVGEHRGYVNTMRNQMPHALDVVLSSGGFCISESTDDRKRQPLRLREIPGDSHPFIVDRNSALLKLPSGDSRALQFLVEPDSDRNELSSTYSAAAAAFVGLLTERFFGIPVQMEFVQVAHEMHLVQARPLPLEWIRESTVTFPDAPMIGSTSSIGVCDQFLKVIDINLPIPGLEQFLDPVVSPDEGLLIISGSLFGGNDRRWEQLLPKRGAVLILQESRKLCGHIETCCLERGLTILYNKKGRDNDSEQLWFKLAETFNDPKFGEIFHRAQSAMHPVPYTPLKPTYLRVVSNGLEGRLYRVD